MDTRQLEYILAIAEGKSLSRAAEQLFLSQSALSQQLAGLSAQGLPPLFFRHKGEMILTDAGKIYINGARTMLKICEDMEENLRNLQGNLSSRLRAAVGSWLQSLFYTRMYPWLKQKKAGLEISVIPAKAGLVWRALEAGEADLAVFSAMGSESHVLNYTVLREDEMVLALSPSGARGRTEALVLPGPGTHLRLICDHAFGKAGLVPDVYAEMEDIPSALALVRSGVCAAVLPRSAVSAAEGIAFTSFCPEIPFYVVAARRRGNTSPLLMETIRQLRTVFEDAP
ncbi:LysR family transcriptional regulator [Treponema sp. OttesenSCG-928-L16]|nr:LysR family transcriptional regulator [Treponema sp. OttesenSCG-928-L16]